MNAVHSRLRAGLCAALLLATNAFAAPFTPGNVVVYRVGNGAVNLVITGNPVFLDEYSPAGALVQTIAMPTAAAGANKPLIASGTAASDGLLTRSTDGTCLMVPGYTRDISVTVGSITTTAGIPRAVAKVTAAAAVDTTTALNDAATGSNFRGVASVDCGSFWVSGGASGVRYATLGATTSADLTSTTFAINRALAIFGGQLYVSTSVTALRNIATVGSGLPTAGAQAEVRLPGLVDVATNSPYAFFLADLDPDVAGVDTMYVADDDVGALAKYSLVGGVWTFNGRIGVATDLYRGLTGVVTDDKKVILYATRKGGGGSAGGGELVKLTDASGYNGAFAGTPTILATAATRTAFRGVALAPGLVTITPAVSGHGTVSPSTPQAIPGATTATFTLNPDPGYSTAVGGTCIGTRVGNTFTTAPATTACTVAVTFSLITRTVTPIEAAHGTITPNAPQAIGLGDTATFQVVPNLGYSASVDGSCGGSLSGTTYTTLAVVADCTVSPVFTLITHTVTPSRTANGSITPDSPQTVPDQATTSFAVAPDFGFFASMGGSCGGTLSGTSYTTHPIAADCSVVATFIPLPRYNVTPSVGANGTVTPSTPQVVIAGQSTAFTIVPAPGYSAAVRGTCGGTFSGDTFTTRAVGGDCTVAVTFARRLVLFVGNSYTFGRVDPVMSYNTANVTDLTHAMWLANASGSNEDEPHPWGGIPGVFKKMTDQAALEYDVSISARNAASLRGHYLNSNPAGWDLRANIASQRWDAVMLQELSDGALPAGRGANANLANFNTYVDKIEAFVHSGAADGAIAANPHARAAAEVYLYQTWARPDMIGPNGTNANGLFYSAVEGIEAMTADLHDAYFGRAAANPAIEDVSPVGDAFLRAVTDGVAMRDPYVPVAGKVNLWHTDFFHPSKYGSYLSAAVHFATLTGLNPLMLGPGEQAAADLGIAPDIAVKLQKVAQAVVTPDNLPPVSAATVSEAPNANGWNVHDITVAFTASDEARGSGLDAIVYSTSGAETRAGTVASGGTITIAAEGVTTVSYFARDRAGNAETARTLRIAIDRTAPTITGMPAAGCNLWPPNGKMVQVATISAAESVSRVSSFSVTAASSEPAATGESDTAIAGSGNEPRTVSLRAKRIATGPGRTYTVTATATDEAGNSAAASATCTVPHDQGK